MRVLAAVFAALVGLCVQGAHAQVCPGPAMTSVIISSSVFCFGGSNGSATVVASGGVGPYTYSWAPSGGTGPTTNGRTAGTYTVTVTDACGNTIQPSVTITQPTAIATSVGTVTAESTPGACDGTAQVTSSGGTGGHTFFWSPGGQTSNPATGLCAGTYQVSVSDANACSTVQAGFAILTVPAAPTGVAATAGNAEATVSFTPGADNGSPITSFTATSNPDGITASDTGSPIVVAGLTNGTAYTFTVTATSAAGTSAASAPSAPVTPQGPPAQPDPPFAVAGNASASITLTAPADDGGSPITGYTVTSTPPGGIDADAGNTNLSRTITGLTNGVQYTFTVMATNAIGSSPASLDSYPVRPALPTAVITVDSLLDDGVGCTLRKAVENANGVETPHAACVTGGLENTIVFAVNGTIALTLDELLITDRSLTIVGNGAANTIVDGQDTFRVFDVCGCLPITLTLRNLTITRGVDSIGLPAGGGIFVDFGTTVRVEDSVLSANGGLFGGAILNLGTLEVTRSTFSGNTTPGGGSLGGAIFNVGEATITDSTFTGNSSEFGGAIAQDGDTLDGISLSIVNSTFSGNTASEAGGAIASYDGDAEITLSHVTVAGNSAGLTGGGGLYNFIGVFNVGRSIVAGNTATGTGADCYGEVDPLTSLDYNVAGTVDCGFTGTNDVVGDPLLLALASNGGPTQTRKPGAGSPAIDLAACGTGADQRGIARPQGTACESGALEIRLPGAPTSAAATGGNGQATVTFVAPASAGDGTITGYTVTSNPPGGVDSNAGTTASSHLVTGLTNGTPYTFTVVATSEYGPGPASAPSNSVTPAALSTAPTIGTATAGNGQATVSFSAPASDGGSPITSYTATSSPGGITGTCIAPCTSITVTGLANGTAYTFTVTATNALGTSPPSAVSNSVTPATVPGAPVIGTATAGNAQATVTFGAPASNGGSAITSYMATSSPGGFTGACAAPCTSITVTGLANGTAYTFTVRAINAVGTGAASAATNSATPAAAVTSFSGPSATGTGTITAVFTGGGPTCSFVTPQFIPLTGHPRSPPAGSAPSNIVFVHGLFDFSTAGCTPGSTITLTITYPAPLGPGTSYWKYGPEPGNATPHWYVMPAAIAGSTATFSITDGAQGDDDLLANGSIVDQGGPGVPPGPGPVQTPTLSEWAMILLGFAMLAVAGRSRKLKVATRATPR